MRGLEALGAALAESEQAARQRRLAFEPDQGFGADQLAGRAEQRMAAIDSAKKDSVELADRSLDQPRIDELEAGSVGSDAHLAGEQSDGDGVEAKDVGPFLGNDMEEMVEPFGLDRREHR